MAQVVDASVAIAWCATTQADSFTDAVSGKVIDSGGHVPAVFWFEVVHALRRLERSGMVMRGIVDQFIEKLAALPLVIDDAYGPEDMVRLHGMARALDLTIYDASYVELALRIRLPVATRARRMADAAQRAGATLLLI